MDYEIPDEAYPDYMQILIPFLLMQVKIMQGHFGYFQ
jgi:hypothetical protein